MPEHTETTTASEALARFRAAEAEMHRRVRSTVALGDNELQILQFLLRSSHRGAARPSEISRELGISSASTTALLDRLEREGRVRRMTHPTDRRSLLIAPTERAESEVADLIDTFERRVTAALEGLDAPGRRAVAAFLDAISDAADEIASPSRTTRAFV